MTELVPARTEAEELAERHIIEYAFNSIDENGHHNLLTAAIKCGCVSCVAAYFSMMDYLTQDWELSDLIAHDQGVSRTRNKEVNWYE